MNWFALIHIFSGLATLTPVKGTIITSKDPLEEKSTPSPEILVLDNIIKRLKNHQEGLNFRNHGKETIDQIIPEAIFNFDALEEPSRNSAGSQSRQKRQGLSNCGYYPCPQQQPPRCPYGQRCPSAPLPFPPPPPYIPQPVPPATYIPPPYQPPAIPPATYIPPPYQPPQTISPSYYIPTLPPPRPIPTYAPPIPRPIPTYAPPIPRPIPTYAPPIPRPIPTYPPVFPPPTIPPRTPPTISPPEPLCPPLHPNTTSNIENLRIALSQAGNCRRQNCCMRPRKEKCAIDYDTLMMRLNLVEERLRDLEKIEARMKISIVILQSIKRDPRFPGSAGDKGEPGVKGVEGPKGPRGYPGMNGICVTRASTNPYPGPMGVPGNKGDPGYPGDKVCNCDGERGEVGDPGDNLTGPQGPRGVKGAKGERGPVLSYREIQ